MRPALDSLLADCRARRLSVVAVRLLCDMGGVYHHQTCMIMLRLGAAVPTLMHETEHAVRDDDGPQPAAIEARINRTVVRRPVTIGEYAAAEGIVGPSAGVLAVERDVPRG